VLRILPNSENFQKIIHLSLDYFYMNINLTIWWKIISFHAKKCRFLLKELYESPVRKTVKG
ncbi:MAG: hypothetical protein ACHQXK_08235, partial [Methanosarcina thermophila]